MSVQQSFGKIVKPRIYIAISSLTVMIGIGTWTFRWLEDWSWAESFYFSAASLTTVGYGDLHPTSDTSRVVTAFFILIGVGIVATSLGSIGSAYVDRRDRMLKEKNGKS